MCVVVATHVLALPFDELFFVQYFVLHKPSDWHCEVYIYLTLVELVRRVCWVAWAEWGNEEASKYG